MKNTNLLILMLFITIATNAQQRIIKGRVTSFNSIGIKQAIVEEIKSKTTVLTDTLGYYELKCDSKSIIRISAKQFRTVKIRVKQIASNTLSTNLDYNIYEFDVDQAFEQGYLRMVDLPNIKQYLENNGPNFCQYTSIFELVQNCCTGVQLKYDSSETGIVIGGSTQNVVYVVNGIQTNSISYLQPCDIASVKILKDPASTAAYLSSGHNGVLLIKTKR